MIKKQKELGIAKEEEKESEIEIKWIEEGHTPDITLEIEIDGNLLNEEIADKLDEIAGGWYVLCGYSAFKDEYVHNMSGLSQDFMEDVNKTVFSFEIDMGSASNKFLDVLLTAVKNLITQYGFEDSTISVKY